ncbi:DUF5723 family protein [Pedobacter boryungensis]|uniref:DUF5723 domain-containing protein n=1 Tax=Pedobacter boryungensis TaxID=869962 RepID=A0ABX2DC88_9SPHI|nr:DUF5723 family protein [Pedobacter boryungensis]NQX31179.1 hypothetical protein [Pedobacter boryungensis]
MKKKYILLVGFLFVASILKAQQYGLFNTKTQFDAFENPAAKSFTLDSSSKFASNFFLPNLGINAANGGKASEVIRKSINENIYSTRNLPLGTGSPNTFYQNTNVYVLTFRIFSSYKYNQEVGLSWQVRSDSRVKYTNETLAIFDSYKRFDQGPYTDVFNDNGYQQSYHQFSLSIRENYNKRLAFGIKLSLLSGIAYNSLKIDNSYFYADANDRLDIGVNGTYKGSFLYNDEISKRTFFPTFKNPGASISLGTTYTSKSGYFLMGNIKDLGLIKWSNSSYIAKFNTLKSIYDVSTKSSSAINEEITAIAKDVVVKNGFITPTNAKADFLISKTFNFYKPSFIISKNLFHPGGDIALVNTFKSSALSASVIPVYNLNDFIMVGLQGMYQTPNFEFFLGTDNIGKTISLAKGINKSDATVGSGYNGGSFYMGLGIKFGRTVNHPQNLSTMPGVNGEKVYRGVFRSLFNFFKKS